MPFDPGLLSAKKVALVGTTTSCVYPGLCVMSSLVLQVGFQRHKARADTEGHDNDPKVVHVPAVIVSPRLADD